MATLVVAKLQIMRANGQVTPLHPMPGPEIVQAYNKRFGTEVREKDFWEVVSFIRAEMGLPLGSNDKGYYWCIARPEWDETAQRLRERIKTQQRSIDRPTLHFARQAQMEIVGREIERQFDAERVA